MYQLWNIIWTSALVSKACILSVTGLQWSGHCPQGKKKKKSKYMPEIKDFVLKCSVDFISILEPFLYLWQFSGTQSTNHCQVMATYCPFDLSPWSTWACDFCTWCYWGSACRTGKLGHFLLCAASPLVCGVPTTLAVKGQMMMMSPLNHLWSDQLQKFKT